MLINLQIVMLNKLHGDVARYFGKALQVNSVL